MSQTVSDFLIDRISEWGVNRIFGYPGDGINGITGALNRVDGKVQFIQSRHEEMAAFMACAHAKFTGRPGVCLATSGPGAIHLLNGLYDAKMDHQPVVAIVGQQARTALGGSYQQEVDLVNLFKDVASDFVQMATVPSQMKSLIDRAFRIALAEKTVTCIIIPNDLQNEDAVEIPPHEHGTVHTGIGTTSLSVVPAREELKKAADILNEGEKVAILVGAGARNAKDEVISLAETLGAGVAKALLGKDVLPDDLPFVTGSIGLLGTKPSYTMMMECDTLFMIGSTFPYSEFLPEEGQAKAVQIDINGKMLSLRYPMDVNLVGDSKMTLQALMPLLEQKKDISWQQKIEEEVKDSWKVLEARAMKSANPVNPQRIFWDLSPMLPDNCIICADSGSSTNWFARDLKIRSGMRASLSGSLATMGPAVPYAIAAKFAYPDRVVIALEGDGAMQMNGINEIITIKKYWQDWSDPRLIVLVLNNGDLNQVTWEQRVLEGDPKFEDSQVLPDFSYASYAQSLGLGGIKIDKPEQIQNTYDSAFSADRPVIIEAVTDPEVPPLPPHIKFEQAKNYWAAILRGDPAKGKVLKQSMKDMMAGYV
ncbi:MAG: thiamine pyrophosphate-requiring protein, partial [Balneolales bacterium]